MLQNKRSSFSFFFKSFGAAVQLQSLFVVNGALSFEAPPLHTNSIWNHHDNKRVKLEKIAPGYHRLLVSGLVFSNIRADLLVRIRYHADRLV